MGQARIIWKGFKASINEIMLMKLTMPHLEHESLYIIGETLARLLMLACLAAVVIYAMTFIVGDL